MIQPLRETPLGADLETEVDRILRSQAAFYRAVGSIEEKRGTVIQPGLRGVPSLEVEAVSALGAFDPRGDVLELACGSGRWTTELLRHADRVTAVDVAPGLLDVVARSIADDPRLTLVAGDLFSWRPPRRFDVVFFAHWLCHMPESRFAWFWSWVASTLKPAGRFFFVEVRETGIQTGDSYAAPGIGTVSHRQLRDGRTFRLIQNHYTPPELQERLRGLGWRTRVEAAGAYSLVGWGGRIAHQSGSCSRPRSDSG